MESIKDNYSSSSKQKEQFTGNSSVRDPHEVMAGGEKKVKYGFGTVLLIFTLIVTAIIIAGKWIVGLLM